ncbi:DNA endonuclease RBBP8 [Betta splendens]|uniref:DNA endonuclease RBBP8 n=1 Tax=Betta splendens TaxID=158456 RepID=A0A6P7MAT6_BETSP|nr:DNA endonuclease RBBP8 [Betta splendens]XP_029003308.1 DNA endonuclease RBBP8 [Betta splendens]
MSSPGQSSGTNQAAELFEGLWRQLRDCHQNVLQELEAKVSKLKKERCLDAQRLEVFYSRNQQLKDQNKTLQDAISLLEERLRAGECDQCSILEESLKNNQDLITALKNERNHLQEENSRLHAQVQRLKTSCSERPVTSSPEHEDCIIPDSPILSSSLPVVNKLKKRKRMDQSKHVRYAELPSPQSNNSLFNEVTKETADASKYVERAEQRVLVPNTCELDTSPEDVIYDAEVVADTCALEPVNNQHMKTISARQSSSKPPWKNVPAMSSTSSKLIHCLDSSTVSPSLLPRVKRFSDRCSLSKAKRKKEDSESDIQQDNKQVQEQVESLKEAQRTSTTTGEQSFEKQPLDSKVQLVGNGASKQNPNVSSASPFKKPNKNWKKEPVGGKETTPEHNLTSHHQHEEDEEGRKLEPTWSIDPALDLSAYDSECRGDEDKEPCPGELVDTDCTWVSHSLLQRQGENSQDRRSVTGLGQKANDSLDMMFDATAHEEYKSYNSSRLACIQADEDDDVDDAEEEEDEEDDDLERGRPADASCLGKARHPTFAHVAVIRKKEERRKLKGTTCKECEVYYAHLPEEEKQKKLSACSRHRFLYVPPSTPENFWEVGFPSTQTCINRGYIKEEKNPTARLRRRQPLNALFSPKQSQQDT